MSDTNQFAFLSNLMGTDRKAEVRDGRVHVSGEIADGVPMEFVIRDSKSSGRAVDVNVDGAQIRHIEGTPRFPRS